MTAGMPHRQASDPGFEARSCYVTALINDQLFAIPISRVQDVFALGTLTPVPLASPDVVGLMNLRGRVVTAIDVRPRLGVTGQAVEPGAMAIGIEAGPDSFGLVVDRMGEVLDLGADTRHGSPATLDPRWRALAQAIHGIGNQIIIEADVDAMLGIAPAKTSSDAVRPGGT